MKSISISKKLAILSVLFLTLPTFLFSLFLYDNQARQFHQQRLNDKQSAIEQLAGNIETKFTTLFDLARNLSYRSNLVTLLSRREPARYPISSAKNINDVVGSIKYSTRFQDMGIRETYIFAENGLESSSYFYDAAHIRDLPFYRDFVSEGRENYLYFLSAEESARFSQAVQNRTISNPAETFLLVQVIRDTYFERIGILVFELSPHLLFRSISQSVGTKDGYFAYFSSSGRFYGAEPDPALLQTFSNPSQKNDTLITLGNDQYPARWIEEVHLALYDATPVDSGLHGSSALSMSLFLAVLALVQTFALNLFTKRIFAKINRSINQMDAIVANGFKGSLPPDGNDEVGQIILRFNLLLKKISLLVSDVVKKETASTKAQIKALQYQMNPHFIYNTLSIFSGHAEQSGNSELAEAIAAFGHLLRYNIKDTGTYATVESEIRNAISLVSVYSIRYVNQLQLKIQVEPELQEARILKFLLQPLLENSILHGLCSPQAAMQIQISVQQKDTFLQLTVSDNGVGISAQRLNEIRSCMLGKTQGEISQTNGSFIGLKNIYERLNLFYEGMASMEIESTEGIGTRVCVRIPISTVKGG